MGALTTQRVRDDFEREVEQQADELRDEASVTLDYATGLFRLRVDLPALLGEDEAARVFDPSGALRAAEPPGVDLGPPVARTLEYRGFRVENREFGGFVFQYARPRSAVEATVQEVRLFLVGGVIGGAGLALLAGLAIARRALRPIAELADTAREVERTRDPGRRVPADGPDDEVAELARTLDGMLRALDAAQAEQGAMLERQRQFVADASHELRTPLTSVLANLELLAGTLDGERGEAAESALRSSQRMRRLVGDLLLLARADAGRPRRQEPLDLAQVVVEAAAELEPVAAGHDVTVDAHPAEVAGVRDELHRLALNLLENAVQHTPPGTRIHASVERRDDEIELAVQDDGPGIPPRLAERVFERFVRGAGDRGGSSGLGLAIVRAVAEQHGGRVELRTGAGGRGTRFVVTLPAVAAAVSPTTRPTAAPVPASSGGPFAA